MKDTNQSPVRSGGVSFFLVVPLLVGAAGLAYAIYTIYYNDIELSERTVVVGEVIANPSSPLVEYEFNGTTYRHQSNGSSSPPDFELGEKVDMYIRPENPENAMMDYFVELWLGPTIAGILGSVFFFGAMFALMPQRKNIYQRRR